MKEQARLINRLTVAADLILIVVAFGVAYYARQHIGGGNLRHIHDYTWILLPALPLWYFLLAHRGMYRSMRHFSTLQIIWRQLYVHFFAGMGLASFVLFVDRDNFSRGLLLLFILIASVLLTVERVLARYGLGLVRSHGYNTRNCLIVGTREKAKEFISLIEQHADWGLRVMGLLQAADGPLLNEVCGYRVLGQLDDLVRICKSHTVDEVVFCIDKSLVVDVEEQLLVLEDLGITTRMVLDFYALDRYRKDLSFFNGSLPILTFHRKSLDVQQLFVKRVIDIAGGVVGTIVAAILYPFCAIAIKLEDPGPVLFSQWRIGENGRKFRIWKFRTMCLDAEKKKRELQGRNEMNGAIFKIKNDPRVTKIGRFLRKTSLDEFPQFWNVLKGEMSLVGTRPPTPDEVELYENWQRRRITIKPGITGLWQVSGRNAIEDFDQIVMLDLRYIDSWNVWLDIRILFKTLWVVLARRGSC